MRAVGPQTPPCHEHFKEKFTPEEDNLVTAAVCELGTTSWYAISERVPHRSARQCRDRWQNYLSPTVGNGPWTPEEDELLIDQHRQHGSSWRRIAPVFPTRTEINLKNRWHVIERRLRRTADEEGLFSAITLPKCASGRPPPDAALPDGNTPVSQCRLDDQLKCEAEFEAWFCKTL
jgi:hypothetical protein